MDIIISPVALSAPQWVIDLLQGGTIYALAQQLWQFVMNIVLALMGMNVSDFTADGAGAWEYITDTVYPLFLGMGAVFLNMFSMAGFCKQASNLKEGITIEALMELFIKLVAANMLMLNCLNIMQEFTLFSVKASGLLLGSGSIPSVVGDDYDVGFTLAMSSLENKELKEQADELKLKNDELKAMLALRNNKDNDASVRASETNPFCINFFDYFSKKNSKKAANNMLDTFINDILSNAHFSKVQKDYLMDCIESDMSYEEIKRIAKPEIDVEMMKRLVRYYNKENNK